MSEESSGCGESSSMSSDSSAGDAARATVPWIFAEITHAISDQVSGWRLCASRIWK